MLPYIAYMDPMGKVDGMCEKLSNKPTDWLVMWNMFCHIAIVAGHWWLNNELRVVGESLWNPWCQKSFAGPCLQSLVQANILLVLHLPTLISYEQLLSKYHTTFLRSIRFISETRISWENLWLPEDSSLNSISLLSTYLNVWWFLIKYISL